MLEEIDVYQIANVAHASCPPYEALSYCWGSRDKDRYIRILPENGGVRAKLAVTRNLWVAFKALAPGKAPLGHECTEEQGPGMKSRLLWVDAVCINQEDDEEKAEEVQLMYKIFRQAWRTVV